ncbi:hypothetical protein HN873_012402, partial [Arachis hypogaea]
PRPHSFSNHHLQWRRRTLAALPEALSPSLAPVVSPLAILSSSNPPISGVAWFLLIFIFSSPGALNFDRLHLHQHAVASHRRSSTVNTGSPPSTPVTDLRSKVAFISLFYLWRIRKLLAGGGGSSGLYAASLSSADQGGNEGEDHPTEADL